MTSKWLGLGLGMGLATVAWIGCGGSEETSNSSSGGTPDAGRETSNAETGPSDASGGGPKDVAFDGFVDAPEVDLTFGTCPAFTPCGGDETGKWKVTGGCLSDAFLADAKKQCPGFTTSDEVIKAKGLVDADGANVIRQTQVTLTAKAFIPLACSPIPDCSAIALGAKTQLGFDKANCTESDGGAGCDCEVEDTIVEQTSDTYTKSGNTITSGSGDTFDYCVAASKLTYTQTNAEFPIFLELGK